MNGIGNILPILKHWVCKSNGPDTRISISRTRNKYSFVATKENRLFYFASSIVLRTLSLQHFSLLEAEDFIYAPHDVPVVSDDMKMLVNGDGWFLWPFFSFSMFRWIERKPRVLTICSKRQVEIESPATIHHVHNCERWMWASNISIFWCSALWTTNREAKIVIKLIR